MNALRQFNFVRFNQTMVMVIRSLRLLLELKQEEVFLKDNRDARFNKNQHLNKIISNSED